MSVLSAMCILFPYSIASKDPLKVNWAHLRSSAQEEEEEGEEELNARELNTTRTCFCLSRRSRRQLHHHHRARPSRHVRGTLGGNQAAPLTLTFGVHSKNGRGRAPTLFSSVACNGTVLPSSLAGRHGAQETGGSSHPYVTLRSVQGILL